MTPDLFTWRDLADILLIGVLLYRLFLVFQRAHAIKILVALAALFGLQLAANSAGLVLTSWFFQAIGPVVILILVVVFRNELREMLLQTNSLRSLIGRPEPRPELDLAGLAAELDGMADEHIGALVVLRNRDVLIGRIQEGIELDCLFDPRLLRAIFLKDSPIHDGAVVIHRNRIARVGVILPLSLRSDLPDEYGTRHRAALGLSESTDAVVIVASEERGEVSVVHRGEVCKTQGVDDLEDALRRLCGADRPRGFTLVRGLGALRLLSGYAASCVLVGLVWWLYFGQEHAVTRVNAKLEFQNIPEGLTVERISDESVDLQIGGQQVVLNSLDPDNVRVTVDLSGQVAGPSREIRIGADDVRLPPGLEVTEISPQEVEVDLVQRMRAVLPIIANTADNPPPGLQVLRREVTPRSLEVVGPEPVLRARDALATTTVIDLSKLDPSQATWTTTARVLLYPAAIQPAANEAPQVRVTIHYGPADQGTNSP